MALWLPISCRYPMARMPSMPSGLRNLLGDPTVVPPWNLPRLQLNLVTRFEYSFPIRFKFDTGADLMIIPTYLARRVGIAYIQSHQGYVSSSMGGRVPCYYDFVTVRSAL